MSTRSTQLSTTASREQEKSFEQIELGPAHPVVVVQPLPDQLSQDGDRDAAGPRIVTEEEAEEHTAYAYKTSLKWNILVTLWLVSDIQASFIKTLPHSLNSGPVYI